MDVVRGKKNEMLLITGYSSKVMAEHVVSAREVLGKGTDELLDMSGCVNAAMICKNK